MQLSKRKALMVAFAALVVSVLIILLIPSKVQLSAGFLQYEGNVAVVRFSNRSESRIHITWEAPLTSPHQVITNFPAIVIPANAEFDVSFTPAPGNTIPPDVQFMYWTEPKNLSLRLRLLLYRFTGKVYSAPTYVLELNLPPQPSTNAPASKQ